MINVTKTYLPDHERYHEILKESWDSAWITNRGPLVRKLEAELKGFLNVDHLTLTSNGTIPLHIAIKALQLEGEIITTPFSYVATTSSIVWENCQPIFVDIEPEHLTIDPSKIEAAITGKTSAILVTHVFGNPCDVDAIKIIADQHNLKVIYDAAHCFGVKYKGQSVFNYGDVATCSFHATKIFHTGEGGCWITNNNEIQDKLFLYHKFGYMSETEINGLGTNGKMSDLQAAMGLAVFENIEDIFLARKKCVDYYHQLLDQVDVQLLKIREGTEWNYHYFPVIFNSEEQLLRVVAAMNKENIFPRRYFYPSLNTIDYVKKQECIISEGISKRIVCLPLYGDLSRSDQSKIIEILLSAL